MTKCKHMMKFDMFITFLVNFIRCYKHVQTCSNIMIWYNSTNDTIWYDFTNMSRHVIMLMMPFDMIFKYVHTCHNAFDAIWYDFQNVQTCPNAYDAIWYDSQTCTLYRHVIIFKDLSTLVLMNTWRNNLKMSQIWANGRRKSPDKAIPWTASTSERSKSALKHGFKSNLTPSNNLSCTYVIRRV